MKNMTQTARSLLMVAVMIASAILPMVPEATELRDEAREMRASITTASSVTFDEGDWGWYEVSLDEAPDGVLVITPTSDNSAVTVDPSYLKFTKVNWDMSQYVYLDIDDTDDDGADTTATISHAISGTDTVFSSTSIADVSVTGVDHDTDTDADGTHDGLDDDDDGDGVDDADEDDGCDLLADCDGDGVTDDVDEFDTDASEDTDSDGDGVGDNGDAFPTDANEDTDSDGDGVGDNGDAFPDDANETTDSDGDGVGDNGDAFPTDANEDTDSDGDGVGDNGDAFPDDANETTDSDGDGVGDNGDAFPNDANEDTDSDGDGVGDNSDWNATDANEDNDNDGDGVGDNADTDDDNDGVADTDEESNAFFDCSTVVDCDGDGVDDSDDAFDLDPEAWDDTDGDGLADTFPNLLVNSYETVQLCGPEGGTEWYDATTYSDGPTGDFLAVSSSDDDSNGNGYDDTECTFTVPSGYTADVVINTGSWGSEAIVDVGGISYTGYGSGAEYDVVTLSAGTYTLYYEDTYGDGCNPSTGSNGACWVQVSYANLVGQVVPSDSGFGTSLDNDDDNDGFSDADEDTCGSDSLNSTDMPTDTDGDGLCDDGVDDDDDGDTVLDADEEQGCSLDTDCDDDGVGDEIDTHDNDASETTDMDGDGIGDNSDNDRDGDGYLNSNDAFENDSTEWADNDGDGTGDNADTDDDTCPAADGADTDNDGTADATCGTYTGPGSSTYDYYPGDSVADADDAFPETPAEWADNDGDGWGDNADYDDDNDGIGDPQDDDMDGDGWDNDDEDTNCVGDGGDSTSSAITPDDLDGDGTCDYLDDDTDGDGTDDTSDAFPEDACADTDTDGDGAPDTIVSGCTSTLTEDDDDDFDASNVQVTYYIYAQSYSTLDIEVRDSDGTVLCTLDGYAEEGCTITAGDISVYATATSYYTYYYYSWYSPTVEVTLDDSSGTSILSEDATYDWYYDNYFGVDFHIGSLVAADYVAGIWTDADEATCGTDPLDNTDTPTDTDGDNLCDDIQDDDNDGDGFTNDEESTDCGEGNDPLDSTDSPTDTDSDGTCDALDDDDDGDGVDDANDACPLDDGESVDTDGDGTCDGDDSDDDGDGTDDSSDAFPLDSTEDTDTDGDGTGDNADTDDDDDGTADGDDAFPLDSTEDTDTDGDGTGDNADTDDDGDGVDDANDACPLDGDESVDTDGDGDCNGDDLDDDGDGVADADEADGSGLATATDCTLVTDCDGDGVDDGDEADGSALDLDDDGTADGIDCAVDTDCDDDGTDDATDDFPVDASETLDTDGDGTGDNADDDDDGDGYSDADETTNCDDGGAYASSGDPLNASDTPDDMDGDGTCDALDGDRDGDFLANDWDGCPDDASGYTDTDGDGACDESDDDDDGDGYSDADDDFPLDASETTDTDGDGVGDNSDADDDGDGTDDQGDECPLDSSGITDNDDDGACDESDADDDNDGVDDADEESGCEFVTDCDGDGVTDDVDAFDNNANVSTDTDGDGWADDFDANAPAAVTYTIDIQSYGDLTIHVFSTSAVPDCVLDTTGPGGDGFDYPNTDGSDPESDDSDSCTVTSSDGISLRIENAAYITYYGAYFGYNSPNVNVSVDGSSIVELDAQYIWYSATYCDGCTYNLWEDMPSLEGVSLDRDDDADGYFDADEDTNCAGDGGDSLDDTATPDDNDGDGICDSLDEDDDNDGYSDEHEADCGTDPMTADDVSDFDGDGVCDGEDADDDDDGTDDDDDWDPYNSDEWADTDHDGVGDNEDDDADGDGTPDEDDSDPTDRCSSTDTDGDGLTDSYDDCSSLGFYSTISADEGDNAGDGLDDGQDLGITDDCTLFSNCDGQWFQVSDTDGVFRMYMDHATGVAAVYLEAAFSSAEWEDEDYLAVHWVGDDGVTTELAHIHASRAHEGYFDWIDWTVPSEDGYAIIEVSTDSNSETIGLDNIAYFDSDWELIAWTHFEDSVGDMGEYATPGMPDLLEGTYTVQIDDSWGDGGHGITVSHGADTLCTIGQYDYSSTASCTFDLTAYSGEEITIAVDTDAYASEGTLTVTFHDGTTATETWSGDTSFSYAHVGDVLLPIEGTYTIEASDSWGDGGQTVTASFEGVEVCSLDTGSTDGLYDSCEFTVSTYDDSSTLDVDFAWDYYGIESSMAVTFPNGTSATYGATSDYGSGSSTYSFAHCCEVQPVAGEVVLSNGHGATVRLDVSDYHTGTEDDDDDNDTVLDVDDAFPTDPDEWDDMDGDGIGSNADNDDDGDGTNDGWDDFPRHAHADTDTDGDGMPNEIGWTDGSVSDGFESGNLSGFDDIGGWSAAGWVATSAASANIIDGSYSAWAASITNGSRTIELSTETTDGWYSFDYAVSTEERYDQLVFAIDGVEVSSFSGQSYHWEFVCDAAGSWNSLDWHGDGGPAISLNDGSIPGNWVNDGYADCGDADGDGTADDESESGWYGWIEDSFSGWVDAGNHTFSWTFDVDDNVQAGSNRVVIDNVMIPYWVQGEGECSDSTDDCNIVDMDDDNDGFDDVDDDCPTDAGENTDTDGDGWCDNADTDDDNDGTYDYNDDMPLDPDETTDSDGDGIGDNADDDDDNDGCPDDQDDLPYDDSDCVDTDGDGLGDDTDPDDDGDNVMDEDDPFPLDGTAWADNDGDGDPDYTGDPPFLGNFEGGGIPAGWTTYGDADWFICGMGSCGTTNGNAINGSYMAESGDINDAETSTLELTIDTLGGDVSFAYETSTEGFWDYLRFYVDGSLTMSWSGITSGTYTTTVSAGYHTFEWMYYKDFSVSSNADTVWVDDIVMPISQVLNQSDLDDDNDGVMDEYDLDPYDPCVSADTDGDGQPDWVATGLIDMSGTGDGDFIVDCDMSMWSEDWDDDGDGWSDEQEWMCGSNSLDAMETPWDFDQDWICDDLDDDLDNDGALNPVNNCGLYLLDDDEASFIDCISDGFHVVDADGDGEGTLTELIHAWAFQWGGCADCTDDGDGDGDGDGDDWDDDGDGDGDGDGGDDGEDIGTTSHDSSHIDVELSILDEAGDAAHTLYGYDYESSGLDENSTEDEELAFLLESIEHYFDGEGLHTMEWFFGGLTENISYEYTWAVEHLPSSEGGGPTFFCGNGDEIPFDYVNDGEADCEDGADEQQYDETGEPINWFDCSDGSQIWIYQVNDWVDDCPDGEDEASGGEEWFYGEFNDQDDDTSGVHHEHWELDVTNDTCLVHATLFVSGSDMSDADPNNWTFQTGTISVLMAGPAFEADEDMDGIPDCLADEFGDDDGDDGDEPGDGDGDGDGGDEPGEPEAWPSQDDWDAFFESIGGFLLQWDADNSSTFSFDEYWQFVTDTNEGFDFENPGYSEDSTEWDQFPYDPTEQSDNDMDGLGDNADADDDNDGVPDSLDAFPLDPTETADLDGDGIGDNSDNDTDGDGIDNDQDDFDSDPDAASDNDGDGADDASDADDDNDGVPDVADWAPLDASEQYDTDGDGIGDNADTDDDGDGTPDSADAFPLDASENADADGDGTGDNADPDDDNDGTPDGLDAFPTDPNEQRDLDGDGIGDGADPDRDEDGVLNSDDAFPMNENEWADTDGDNIGDNSDSDIDGDDVLNADDWAPTDISEWADTDNDGTGDNADSDDDGDGYSDNDEYDCGTDSKNPNSVPSDYDGDGTCDAMDSDPTGDRSDAEGGQEAPGFTPGFPSVLAAISLLGAAVLGRRKED